MPLDSFDYSEDEFLDMVILFVPRPRIFRERPNLMEAYEETEGPES